MKFLLLFISFFALAITGCEEQVENALPAITLQTAPLTITAPGGKNKITFTVEIAQTESARKQGLMHRQNLPQTHGMLFIWPQPAPIAMWMKNTPLPLDILFIQGDTIVQIHPNARPNNKTLIPALHPVDKVLELNAGTVAAHGIKPGWKIIAI